MYQCHAQTKIQFILNHKATLGFSTLMIRSESVTLNHGATSKSDSKSNNWNSKSHCVITIIYHNNEKDNLIQASNNHLKTTFDQNLQLK